MQILRSLIYKPFGIILKRIVNVLNCSILYIIYNLQLAHACMQLINRL
jgi:hypothetical protein